MLTLADPSTRPLPEGWFLIGVHGQVSILTDGNRRVGLVQYRSGHLLWWWRVRLARIQSRTPSWCRQLTSPLDGLAGPANRDLMVVVSVPNQNGFATFKTRNGWVKVLPERLVSPWLTHLSGSSVLADLAA